MRIGVVGKSSYIGLRFQEYCQRFSDLEVIMIDSREDKWRHQEFSGFSTIIHAAGIAHVSRRSGLKSLYEKVNRDLPIDVAQKAKESGVKQFVFLSSILVYGNSQRIDLNSRPAPGSNYAKSKLEAETGLLELADDSFSVALIRMPMVYGEGCKGNFPRLLSLAKRTWIFPDLKNYRSMIYIQNLCAYLVKTVHDLRAGFCYPQNANYVSTTEIVKLANQFYRRKVLLTKVFNVPIEIFSRWTSVLRKLFGSLYYEKSMSPGLEEYNEVSFEESMRRCIVDNAEQRVKNG